jgi:tetratricopeptide (TPR) repeat protein
MTFFARPSEWTRAHKDAGGATPYAGGSQHYFAFLSYSHRDEGMAEWLHEELEKFRVPHHFVGRVTAHGPIPRRLTPVFRDLGELPASDDLGGEIRTALSVSRFLVVLCSPAASGSRWTNAEIATFKRVRPDGEVLAAIVDGEPFASEIPGREHEECLPLALRFKYDRRGKPTAKKAEPLAADLRGDSHARRMGFLKLVAGMLGVGLDELVRRDHVRRQRRLAILAAASLSGMVVTSGLAFTAIQARDAARDQRREAESLVEFMLGDLRSKLEPLGRLDVLDSVGGRALGYYEKQDKGSLSDESLAQRSKALTLLGEIANTRGDLDTALRLYREAYASTGESLRRNPSNPQRMYDHAQNVFWVGFIDWQQGRLNRAEAAMREYQGLARGMVTRAPGVPRYRLEMSYANSGLGTILIEQRKYREAAAIFGSELAASEALLAAEPGNSAYQDRLIEALAWLADAREKTGDLEDAIAQRERQLNLMRQLSATRKQDSGLRRKMMTGERVIGRLFASRGETRLGLEHLQRAAGIGDELMRIEPGNTEWAQYASDGVLELGHLQLALGQSEAAAVSARAGCDVASRLLQRDSSVAMWRAKLRGQCLDLRARLALARDAPAEAQLLADQLVALTRTELGRNRTADTQLALAEAEMLRGDVALRMGDHAAAKSEWQAGLAAWPRNVELKPDEQGRQSALLQRLGKSKEAGAIAARLATIGYRHPEYVNERKRFGRG